MLRRTTPTAEDTATIPRPIRPTGWMRVQHVLAKFSPVIHVERTLPANNVGVAHSTRERSRIKQRYLLETVDAVELFAFYLLDVGSWRFRFFSLAVKILFFILWRLSRAV